MLLKRELLALDLYGFQMVFHLKTRQKKRKQLLFM